MNCERCGANFVAFNGNVRLRPGNYVASLCCACINAWTKLTNVDPALWEPQIVSSVPAEKVRGLKQWCLHVKKCLELEARAFVIAEKFMQEGRK